MSRTEIIEVKGILDRVFGSMDMGRQMTDFKVCSLTKDSEGNVRSTKWMNYLQLCELFETHEEWVIKTINQRTVMKNEIVLDLESMERVDDIVEMLKEMELTFRVYSTRSRGVHIHIFFKSIITDKERAAFVKAFEADDQITEGHMISLEGVTHYKHGKLMKEIFYD